MSQELTDNPPGIWGLGEIGLPMFYKHAAPLGLRVGSTMFAIHISPRWGFDTCVFGISIHIALLWSAGIELIAVL